jgi:hypothetical protein
LHLQQLGYGAVYFVDDHFLLQPKRIEAICQGITAAGVTIQWRCEGRVDSTTQHLFPVAPIQVYDQVSFAGCTIKLHVFAWEPYLTILKITPPGNRARVGHA